MSLTHETIRNENKELLDKIILNEEKLYDLEDYKETTLHSLYYSRRHWTDEQYNSLYDNLEETIAQIDRINESKRIKCDLKSTMALIRVTTLQSFRSRNLPDINKILSDSNLLKHIVGFNTGL